jgi:membrane protease YdiL (CAAX protease family)
MLIPNFLIFNLENPSLNLVLLLSIVVLFLLQVFVQYKVFKKKNTFSHNYPVNTFLLFAPIYEEIIFRGFLFFGLVSIFGVLGSALINLFLFSIWHIRSMFYMSFKKVIKQMTWTGLVIGPICLIFTYYTGNIWLAVIFHYLNNILAPLVDKDNF